LINARVVHDRMGWLCVKRPVISRQTSSDLTSNVQIVWPRLNARVLRVRTGWLCVKRPRISRQTYRIDRIVLPVSTHV